MGFFVFFWERFWKAGGAMSAERGVKRNGNRKELQFNSIQDHSNSIVFDLIAKSTLNPKE